MLTVAHRGLVGQDSPENSLAACEQAIFAGCDAIELDVRVTGGGAVVLMHDANCRRTTGVDLPLEAVDAAALAALRLTNGEPIPQLVTVLEHFVGRIRLNLELKDTADAATAQVAALVAACPRPQAVVLSSFHERPLLYLARYQPQLQRAVLWGNDTLKSYPRYFFHPEEFLSNCQASAFYPQVDWLTPPLAQAITRRGLPLLPWVPMGREEDPPGRERLWSSLVAMNIMGLCTNYPVQWREFCR